VISFTPAKKRSGKKLKKKKAREKRGAIKARYGASAAEERGEGRIGSNKDTPPARIVPKQRAKNRREKKGRREKADDGKAEAYSYLSNA